MTTSAVSARMRAEALSSRASQTFLTRMVRQGSDLVLVAEIAGHRRLETTRRYSLPSDADRLLAVERLQIDF